MKRSELKEILRPIVRELIRESLQESLLESGILSSVISEVMSGLSASSAAPGLSVLTERQSSIPKQKDDRDERMRERLEEQKNQRRKLLDSIGFQAQDGTNPFSGTQPLRESAAPIAPDNPSSVPLPTAGLDPHDPGIDISKLLGGNRKFKV